MKNQAQQAVIFLLAGTCLWIGALMVRSYITFTNPMLLFIVGSLPNFGTAWMLPSFLILVNITLTKRQLSLKVVRCMLVVTFILQNLSELYYVYFAGASFDLVDCLFGLGALLILEQAMKRI